MIKPTLFASSLKNLTLTTILTTSVCTMLFLSTAQASSLAQAPFTRVSAQAEIVEPNEQIEFQFATIDTADIKNDDVITIAVKKPQKVPNFAPQLDAVLSLLQDEDPLNMMAKKAKQGYPEKADYALLHQQGISRASA